MPRLLSAAVAGVLLALTLAACGTGGRVEQGSTDNGRTLFREKCASCHTLEAAGSTSEIGPNLDDSFAQARADGFKESAIRDIVADQIRDPGQYATGERQSRAAGEHAGEPRQGTGPRGRRRLRRGERRRERLRPAVAVSGTNGKTIFVAKCGSCHTLKEAGTTGTIGPNLDQLKPPFDRAKKQVINGGGVMPAFKGVLTDAQIDAVAKYVAEQAGKSGSSAARGRGVHRARP